MDLNLDDSIRAELRMLSPEGDLVAVADDMRRMGVDSLLICRPGGRIAQVVSEHRVRRLAQPEPQGLTRESTIPESGAALIPSPSPSPSPESEGVRAQKI